MAKRNRNTLKLFFRDGAMPSADMFTDLIDSTINLNDDGLEKTEAEGIKITNSADHQNLSSYYDERDLENPVWQLKFCGDENNLAWYSSIAQGPGFDPGDEDDAKREHRLNSSLVLSRDQGELRVGVGTPKPKASLDVNGGVRSASRRGSYGKSFVSLPADGEWHTITENITGAAAFEVLCRAKNESKRRYAMMHAIAMHCPWKEKKDFFGLLGIRNRIRHTHVYHDSVLHKLKLRWLEGTYGYALQLRSNCEYGFGGVMDFHITRLWSDEDDFDSESGFDELEKPL